jgi:hypothetical protein
MTLGIDMYEVKFGFRAIALYGVIGRCVDVPTFEPDSYVVVGHGGAGGEVLIVGIVHDKGRTIAPVIEVAVDGVVVVEMDYVV